MAKNVLTTRKASKVSLPVKVTTATLPDGTTVNAGDMLAVAGEEGRFKFKAVAPGGGLTVWGPYLAGNGEKFGGPWAHAGTRTFHLDQFSLSAAAEAVKATVTARATANGETPYEEMTPGQKAAFTKRMKAMTLAVAA